MNELPDERRWSNALDGLDPHTVRVKLDPMSVGRALDTPIDGIVDVPPYPTRRFIEDWLKSRENAARRIETSRFWIILVIATISAVAAIVAAYYAVFPSSPH
jgi:hypothetical protein